MKSESETKINKEVNIYRNDVMTHLKYIREKVNENHFHLTRLNDRVRKTESSISWIKGIGTTITFLIGSLLAWFNANNQ